MLKNHIAMITGCSGGIGLKTLEIFSKNNADIIAFSRKLNKSFEDFCKNKEQSSFHLFQILSFAIFENSFAKDV